MAGISFLAFLLFANQSLFFIWQSAFTHANISAIQKWFLLSSVLAILSMMVTVFLVLRGIKISREEQKKN